MSDDLEPMTPTEGVEAFLAHRKPSVAESTYYNNQTTLEQFTAWCSDNEIDNLNDLSGRDLALFVAHRREKVKPITLQKNLSAIREFLSWAADIEAVPEGLNEKVHAPVVPDGSESRSIKLERPRAEKILEYLDRYEYASRDHVIMAILWRTGMRLSALRSIDLDDLEGDQFAIYLKHRPETDTPLKNKDRSERWVFLGPEWYSVVSEYIKVNRIETTDDYGREPLLTTKQGRISGGSIRNTVYRCCQPCFVADCPHDRDPETCEAVGAASVPSKCPSTRSPHAIRRGAITGHLLEDVPPEIVSDRMDVSLDVLYQHYDARQPDEKMEQRRKFLEGF
ncbi:MULTISPECIES: tyrosine-type recombinase/integrase [Natrinema]|uniref:Integrase n=2 Tax=Natrinema TaxID=88723 RepID=A0A2A5QWL7_9EURY|nr:MULTISPECIES: tyrosine-type recombinase/integrase [Natrinema]MBZ6494233.1 tyrosine-type recombinase/integrase [Natrinema longum]PCR91248.1 integrase [Natrinema ejinorense]QSW84441.1 tyrosine-type recombinase/integrase [Natrinema longum]